MRFFAPPPSLPPSSIFIPFFSPASAVSNWQRGTASLPFRWARSLSLNQGKPSPCASPLSTPHTRLTDRNWATLITSCDEKMSPENPVMQRWARVASAAPFLTLSFSDQCAISGLKGVQSPSEKHSAESEREGTLGSLAEPCGDLRTALEL